jgi:phospholipase C
MASGLPMTRRTALRAGAGAGVALAAGAGRLPAWARPVAELTRVRRPGSRPVPRKPEGEHLIPEIRHVVVVMMENHSFDNVLGMLPHRVRSRRGVDGLPTTRSGRQLAVNRDAMGNPVRASHDATVCPPGGISQNWKASHVSWNNGRNDGFVRGSSAEAMSFFDQPDIPFTYALASQFPIGERYFGSTLCQTYPNRRFLFTGTASGLTRTDGTTFSVPATNGTIFDRLDRLGISWKTYYTGAPSMAIIPNVITPPRQRRVVKIDRYYADAASGRLPAVSFVEPDFNVESQENPQDIQFGERFLSRVVRALLRSPAWEHSALFVTYDEHGGFYDHVPPPRAIKPDSTPPRLRPDDPPGSYDRYGFRVPLIAVSPFARANYVSRVVQDHTSILRFIERTWNIGAITFRDANAADMTDYFDFRRPAFRRPPHLAAAPPIAPGLANCRAHGQNPPVLAAAAGSAAAAASLRARLPRS